MDVDNPLVIYAGMGATPRGVWRTDDGGDTWSPCPGLPDYRFDSVKADPHVAGLLFAGGNDGCWRSTDYGDTWVRVLYTSSPGNPVENSDIAIHESVVFYACDAGLFRSTNAGIDWEELTNGIPTGGLNAVSCDENIVYVGGSLWKSLYKSTDTGESFCQLNIGFPAINVNCIGSTILFPSTTVYSGANTHTGLFKTENNGYSWFHTTCPQYKVTEIAVWPENPDIILAVIYNSFAPYPNLPYYTYRSVDGGEHFYQVFPHPAYDYGSPPVSEIVFDLAIPNIVYLAVSNVVDVDHFFISYDYGFSWIDPNDDTGPSRVRTINALSTNYFGTVLYEGTSDGVYKSMDNGITWIRAGLEGVNVNSLSMSWVDGMYLVAGTENGVYRTFDDGATWSEMGLSGIEINDVFGEIIETYFSMRPNDVYNREILWVATNQGVYEYFDGQWISRNAGLEALEVRELTLTRPHPFTIQEVPIRMHESIIPFDINSKICSSKPRNGNGGQTNSLRDDIVPLGRVRRSILHAATALGTYEYAFIEP